LSRELVGTETIIKAKGPMMFYRYENTAPFILLSKDPIIIDESIVFNFPFKTTVEPGAHLKDHDDVSGTLATHIMGNYKKIQKLEESFVHGALIRVTNEKSIYKNPYVDFFEKIVAGMCVAELTGVMTGAEFQEFMYDMYFNDDNIRLNINLTKTILALEDGPGKVEDKIYNSAYRMNKHGDLVYVEMFDHKVNLESNAEPTTYLLIFSKRQMYKRIKKDVDISFSAFHKLVDSMPNAISWDNAVKNYRMLDDLEVTPLAKFKEYFNDDKTDFAALKVSISKYKNVKDI
jgi:hypothetical protein